jgi:DNA mismatch repair protein MLH1
VQEGVNAIYCESFASSIDQKKKQSGSASPDLSTPSSSETSAAIRLLYGHSVAKELLHIKISSSDKGREETDMDEDDTNDDAESWNAASYFTNANYQAKKIVFLLFINRK